MEKRASQRVPVTLEFHCFDTEYFGTVTNLSEKGMFIKSQKICFPLMLQFEISIPVEQEMLNIPVKVNRMIKSNGYYDGMGVELLEQPQKYLEFINWLMVDKK